MSALSSFLEVALVAAAMAGGVAAFAAPPDRLAHFVHAAGQAAEHLSLAAVTIIVTALAVCAVSLARYRGVSLRAPFAFPSLPAPPTPPPSSFSFLLLPHPISPLSLFISSLSVSI